jgi:hypothetical protein
LLVETPFPNQAGYSAGDTLQIYWKANKWKGKGENTYCSSSEPGVQLNGAVGVQALYIIDTRGKLPWIKHFVPLSVGDRSKAKRFIEILCDRSIQDLYSRRDSIPGYSPRPAPNGKEKIDWVHMVLEGAVGPRNNE